MFVLCTTTGSKTRSDSTITRAQWPTERRIRSSSYNRNRRRGLGSIGLTCCSPSVLNRGPARQLQVFLPVHKFQLILLAFAANNWFCDGLLCCQFHNRTCIVSFAQCFSCVGRVISVILMALLSSFPYYFTLVSLSMLERWVSDQNLLELLPGLDYRPYPAVLRLAAKPCAQQLFKLPKMILPS